MRCRACLTRRTGSDAHGHPGGDTVTPTISPTVTPTGISCSGIRQWRDGLYHTGDRVVHEGRLWQAGERNNGIQLALLLESADNPIRAEFPSTENPDTDRRPHLVIAYADTLPTPTGGWTYTEVSSTRYEYQHVVTGEGLGDNDAARVNQTRQVGRESISTGGFRYTETKTNENHQHHPI